jgi:outer membrane protein assembly factor BamD
MRKRKIAVVLLIALGSVLGTVSCNKAAKAQIAPEVASSDEALFKEGEKYQKKDPEKARLYFRQVIDSFPRSFYAQRAKLAIADTYFAEGDEGNMILAATEYQDFIRTYPISPSAAYAQYRAALCSFNKILKPGRDQAKTIQALADLKKVIAMYPTSEEAKLAQENIKLCEENLAEHNFQIGLHYYRAMALKASTTRLADILTSYPNYTGQDKVLFYLGDSYRLWTKPDQALPYFTKLITDFPKSPFVKKSQEHIQEIRALPAPAPPVKK